MKKIKLLSLSNLNRLNNNDFSEVYGLICSTLERSEMSEQYLITCLESVQTHRQSLGFLKTLRAMHPISIEMGNLSKKRHDYFSVLKSRVTYNLKSPFEAEQNASQKLEMWLQPYRKMLVSKSIYRHNNVVNQMLADVQSDPTITTAMSDACVSDLFQQIVTETQTIHELFQQRSEDKEIRNKMVTVARRAAYQELKTLIGAFDMAVKQGSEDSELCVGYKNEVARTLDLFYGMTLNRSTRKKNAKEAEQKQQAVIGLMDNKKIEDTAISNAALMSDSSKSRPIVPSVAMTESVINGEPHNGHDNKEVEDVTIGNIELSKEASEETRLHCDNDIRQGRSDVKRSSDQEE